MPEQSQRQPEEIAFSEAADWRAIEEQLGSPEESTALQPSSFASALNAIHNLPQLREFLAHFQANILAKEELPIILRAYHHARENQARELIALDRSIKDSFANESLANASQQIGRNQLRRLRALKHERVITRYWDAVSSKQANGWHTIVFGVVLATYSIPLRQGLHHYSQQTIRGFLEAGATSLRLRRPEVNELESSLLANLPALVEKALAGENGELRCV
jgi:urease accessory protein UreF